MEIPRRNPSQTPLLTCVHWKLASITYGLARSVRLIINESFSKFSLRVPDQCHYVERQNTVPYRMLQDKILPVCRLIETSVPTAPIFQYSRWKETATYWSYTARLALFFSSQQNSTLPASWLFSYTSLKQSGISVATMLMLRWSAFVRLWEYTYCTLEDGNSSKHSVTKQGIIYCITSPYCTRYINTVVC